MMGSELGVDYDADFAEHSPTMNGKSIRREHIQNFIISPRFADSADNFANSEG